jgi:hypothetical protein
VSGAGAAESRSPPARPVSGVETTPSVQAAVSPVQSGVPTIQADTPPIHADVPPVEADGPAPVPLPDDDALTDRAVAASLLDAPPPLSSLVLPVPPAFLRRRPADHAHREGEDGESRDRSSHLPSFSAWRALRAAGAGLPPDSAGRTRWNWMEDDASGMDVTRVVAGWASRGRSRDRRHEGGRSSSGAGPSWTGTVK